MRTNWLRSAKLLSAAAFGLLAASALAQGPAPAPVVTGLTGAKGLAYNRITHKLYVSTDAGVAIVDSTTYNVETIIPTSGSGEVAADTRRNRFAYTTPDGVITVANGDDGSSLNNVGIPQATGLAVDPQTGRFFVSVTTTGSIFSIDSSTGAYNGGISTMPGDTFTKVACDGTEGVVYAVHRDNPYSSFTAYNEGTFFQVGSGGPTTNPSCVVVNPNTNRFYLGEENAPTIEVYDTSDFTHALTINLPGNVQEVDMDRRAEILYAIGDNRTSLYRINAKTGDLMDSVTASSAAGFQRLAVDGVSGEVYVTDGESLLKWAAPLPAPGCTYRTGWIAEYPGAVRMQQWIINTYGQVTAWAVLPFDGSVTPARGFVNDVDGVMYEPFPNQNCDIFFINNLQQITGGLRTGSARHAFVSDISGSNFTEILPFTSLFSRGIGLNELGQVVGEGRLADGSDRGFAYDPVTGITDLGSFGGARTEPYELTNNGIIVGHSQVPSGDFHGAASIGFAPLYDVGTLGGLYSSILGMNDIGQAVGGSAIADGTEHAFFWDQFDGVQDLGAIDTWSEGNDYNNNGLMIGNGDGGPLLFDFFNGMRYMLPVTDVTPGYVIDGAGALNDDGYIVANSHRDTGEPTDSVLIPTPTDTVTAMSIAPEEVSGGESATGKIVLGAPAGSGGVDVALSSDTPQVTVDSTVHVDEGQYVATFNVTTTPVPADVTAVVTAVSGTTTFGSSITVHAPGVASITFASPSVVGSVSNTATIHLADPAPVGGAEVHVTAAAPAAIDTTVTVPEGDTSIDVVISTIPVGIDTSVTVSADYHGASTGQFTVRAPRPVSITSDNQVAPGGVTVTFYVHLDGPAPANFDVVMSSNNANAPVGATVSFGEGSVDGGSALITKPVDTDQTAKITATKYGTSAFETLTIQAAQIKANVLNPGIVFGGQSSTGTVTLTGPAGPSGAVIALTKTGTAATLPQSSITIPAGGTTKTYTVNSTTVTATTTATINAKWKTITKSATLTVKPVQMAAMNYLNASSVTITTAKGGTVIKLRVTISGPAPAAGAVVNVTTSNSKALPLPNKVTIPGGQTSVVISNIKLGTVKTSTLVTGTGTYNSTSKSATFTVTP